MVNIVEVPTMDETAGSKVKKSKGNSLKGRKSAFKKVKLAKAGGKGKEMEKLDSQIANELLNVGEIEKKIEAQGFKGLVPKVQVSSKKGVVRSGSRGKDKRNGNSEFKYKGSKSVPHASHFTKISPEFFGDVKPIQSEGANAKEIGNAKEKRRQEIVEKVKEEKARKERAIEMDFTLGTPENPSVQRSISYKDALKTLGLDELILEEMKDKSAKEEKAKLSSVKAGAKESVKSAGKSSEAEGIIKNKSLDKSRKPSGAKKPESKKFDGVPKKSEDLKKSVVLKKSEDLKKAEDSKKPVILKSEEFKKSEVQKKSEDSKKPEILKKPEVPKKSEDWNKKIGEIPKKLDEIIAEYKKATKEAKLTTEEIPSPTPKKVAFKDEKSKKGILTIPTVPPVPPLPVESSSGELEEIVAKQKRKGKSVFSDKSILEAESGKFVKVFKQIQFVESSQSTKESNLQLPVQKPRRSRTRKGVKASKS